jgi:hypothetical protein
VTCGWSSASSTSGCWAPPASSSSGASCWEGLGTVWCGHREGVGTTVQKFDIYRGPTIHSSVDECTVTHMRRLINEYSGLYFSVPSTFLDFGTKEFSSVIFLGTKEYKISEEDILFSSSEGSHGSCY